VIEVAAGTSHLVFSAYLEFSSIYAGMRTGKEVAAIQEVKRMQRFSKLSQRDLVRHSMHTGSQAFNPFPCNDRSWSDQHNSSSSGQSFLPVRFNLSAERHLRARVPDVQMPGLPQVANIQIRKTHPVIAHMVSL
jgi:hypothetical protein